MQPLTPSPRRVSLIALYALSALISIALLVVLVLPGGWWEWHLMPPRSYSAAALGEVVADLERNGVIPVGTTWASPSPKARAVTVSFWFLPPASTAVADISRSAGVLAVCPWQRKCTLCGEHFSGPMHITWPVAGRTGLERIPPIPGQRAVFKPGA